MSDNVVLDIKEPSKKIIRIYGTDYEVKKLTWGMARKYKEDGAGKESEEWLHEMLVNLGIPSDVLMDLEPNNIEAIVNALMPSKKK